MFRSISSHPFTTASEAFGLLSPTSPAFYTHQNMSASQDSKNSALFNWLSEAWVKILFQPDDDLAVNTFNKTFANDIVIKSAAFLPPCHVSTILLYR